MISKSQEEYLKTMYILKKQNGNIRVTDIANKMNCTKPSVNKAIYNLKDNGLLNYESYGTIELTEKRWRPSKKDNRSLWYCLSVFEGCFKYRRKRCRKWSWKHKICNYG